MATNSNGVVTLGNSRKTVGDPNSLYDSLAPVYKRNRAAISGQRHVKDIDGVVSFNNLLIPFDSMMDQEQYNIYTAEAEYPGFVTQFAGTLVGGLLRKQPQLTLPDDIPEDAEDWLMNNFGQDNGSLISFLDSALWEEMNTSRAFVCVNYPVTSPDEFTPEELQPYPILLRGESIINWATGINTRNNRLEMTRLVVRMFREKTSEDNPYHPDYIDTVWVHQLDEQGYYEIIVFEQSKEASANTQVIAGKIQQDYAQGAGAATQGWTEVERETNILRNGDRLDYIPIFPLNGEMEPIEPMLTNVINREVALYNKISRRNHLLYGSAAYTPVVSADGMNDDDKDEVARVGLGSWLFLPEGGSATILAAPTEGLQGLEAAIEGSINEMARLGMRILSPETNTDQSGAALEIRNAAQTSQLATLNNKVSETMRSIIRTMVNWRYNTEYNDEDFEFTLSTDFNPAAVGVDWMRLITEWYQSGLIPKSTWVQTAKQNDAIPSDYNEEEAQEEIEGDENIVSPRERFQEIEMPAAEAAMMPPPNAPSK